MDHNAQATICSYCKCGAGIEVTAPLHAALKTLELFWENHVKSNCGPTDDETARKEYLFLEG